MTNPTTKSVEELIEAEIWIGQISVAGELHKPDCICQRCKNGKESFLIPADIRRIQANAFRAAAKMVEKHPRSEWGLKATLNNAAHSLTNRANELEKQSQ